MKKGIIYTLGIIILIMIPYMIYTGIRSIVENSKMLIDSFMAYFNSTYGFKFIVTLFVWFGLIYLARFINKDGDVM